MKKFLLPAMALLASLLTAQAQFFTNTNLVVLQISGYDSSSSVGAAIFIDQYTTNGTLINSNAIPTSGASALIQNGVAYEGLMTITPDNGHLVIPGYAIPLASSTSQVNFTASSIAPRAIGILDAYGDFSLPVKSTTVFSGYTLTGAASDGTNYWMAGNGPPSEFTTGLYPQVVSMGTASSPTSVQVCTNVFGSGVRNLNVYNVGGALGLYECGFASNTAYSGGAYGSGSWLLSNISGVLPTTATGASNYFPDLGANGAIDITINPAGTIAYLADGSIGIVKFTNPGTGWVSNYAIVPTNAGYTIAASGHACSVTADWTQSPPVIYAVTEEIYTNRLVRIVDTNGSLPAVVNLAFGTMSAGVFTNTLRGVRFAPSPIPVVTVAPVAFAGISGQTATCSATVLGVNTYQWYSNSVANPTYVAISGATATNLSLSGITSAQSGSLFYLVAVNSYGTATTTPVSLTVADPIIITQPAGETNFPGSPSDNLFVYALGTAPLTYQWLSNGIPISGAQMSNYTAVSSLVSNSATYSVIVSNGLGASVTSSATVVSYSPYLLFDTFTYANGNLFGDAGSPWTDINGTNAELVINGRVQVSQTNATTDAQSLFSQTVPVSPGTVIWSSFIINMTTLPGSQGVYFANLEGATDFQFVGCIYALVTNAFPGTYRLGIASTNEDFSAGKGGPSGVVPVDLAPGIDYQVVMAYDMVNEVTYLSVDPNVTTDTTTSAFESDPYTAFSTDGGSFYTNAVAAFGLRQRSGMGTMQLDNLEVSLDTTVGSTTICGLCAVTAGITPQAPVVGFQPTGFTNYTGGSNVMEVAASAIGSGINPSYYWYKNSVGSPGTYTNIMDGGDFTGSSTAAITLSSEVAADAGTYYCVVSNAVAGAQSSSVVVSIITTPTAPFFISPTNATTNSVTIGNPTNLTALADGSGPITYAWYFDGNFSTPVGTGASLALSGASTNQTGTYNVVATGTQSPPATSSNFVFIVVPPTATNIAYLRSLMILTNAPTVTISATNTTEYQITGTVITADTLISSEASYIIQDSTGGIDFFVNDTSFRPNMGDIVTVVGTLSIYGDGLELDASKGSVSETYTIVNTNFEVATNVYPVTPIILPPGYGAANPSNIALVDVGSFIMFTNVYFTAANGTAVFAAETDYTLTNKGGTSYGMTVYSAEGPSLSPTNSIVGQVIPKFAYSVAGAMDQYDSTYELNVTRLADIVTAPPPPVTNLTAALSGVGNTNVSLSWTAIPYRYTYSIKASTNVAGPYTNLAPGLMFTSTNAAYTNIGPGGATKFYEIVSP